MPRAPDSGLRQVLTAGGLRSGYEHVARPRTTREDLQRIFFQVLRQTLRRLRASMAQRAASLAAHYSLDGADAPRSGRGRHAQARVGPWGAARLATERRTFLALLTTFPMLSVGEVYRLMRHGEGAVLTP